MWEHVPRHGGRPSFSGVFISPLSHLNGIQYGYPVCGQNQHHAKTGRDCVSTRIKGSHSCAVKGAGLQRVKVPPGNWFAPPGSNRSGGGGNETAEASDGKGRVGDPASL